MGEGGPDTSNTDTGVSDALIERVGNSRTSTPSHSLRLSLPSLGPVQSDQSQSGPNLPRKKELLVQRSPDVLQRKELLMQPSLNLDHQEELSSQSSPESLNDSELIKTKSGLCGKEQLHPEFDSFNDKELFLDGPRSPQKNEMLDPCIHVIPVDMQVSTPSSRDSPPLYRDLDIARASTSQCAAINEEFLIPKHELSFLPHFKDFTASESCSLILPTVLDSKTTLSDSSSAILAICRICHMPGDEDEILISPCRCAGTLQFIHDTCLQRWLEIVSKKSRKPPKCELCHFQYHRHKKFKLSHFRFPKVSFQDKVLHSIFLLALLLMIGCAIATVMCFLSDKGQIRKLPRNNVELTTEEIITLACGVIFFVSFFVAMSVEIKAKHTVYQLFVKFIMRNMEWKIDAYDRSKDSLYAKKYNCNNNNSASTAQFV